MRLSGPRAALVQVQLEQLAGANFGGARAPERRRTVKSADLRLTEFPLAPPDGLTCRMRVLEAFGLTEESLAVLVAMERDILAAKKERQADRNGGTARNQLMEQHEEEYDDYDDL